MLIVFDFAKEYLVVRSLANMHLFPVFLFLQIVKSRGNNLFPPIKLFLRICRCLLNHVEKMEKMDERK